jgi:hypothetical protein
VGRERQKIDYATTDNPRPLRVLSPERDRSAGRQRRATCRRRPQRTTGRPTAATTSVRWNRTEDLTKTTSEPPAHLEGLDRQPGRRCALIPLVIGHLTTAAGEGSGLRVRISDNLYAIDVAAGTCLGKSTGTIRRPPDAGAMPDGIRRASVPAARRRQRRPGDRASGRAGPAADLFRDRGGLPHDQPPRRHRSAVQLHTGRAGRSISSTTRFSWPIPTPRRRSRRSS